MTDRMFMVSVDITDPAFEVGSLKRLIKDSKDISGWWNHIPSLYLIRTKLDEDQLTDLLRDATRDARLLVMQVEPSVSQGWLRERSWQWIKRHKAKDNQVAS